MSPANWSQQVSASADYMLSTLHAFREQANITAGWAVILSIPLIWPLLIGTATALLTKEK